MNLLNLDLFLSTSYFFMHIFTSPYHFDICCFFFNKKDGVCVFFVFLRPFDYSFVVSKVLGYVFFF